MSILVNKNGKLLAFLAILAAAAPAEAQLRPSPLGDIYESYNDCFKVAAKGGIKPEVLGTLGWSRATISKDGKQVASEPAIYGHTKRAPIIFLTAETGEGLCTVMARLESVEAFDEFKKAWGGNLPKPDKDGVIGFYAEGHPILLRATGTREKPAMTISVMTPAESK